MAWTKPNFVEISLAMEVTAYVNTDDSIVPPLNRPLAVGEEDSPEEGSG